MTKILVTGSKGFIGRAVVKELGRRGYSVVPYDLPAADVRNYTDFHQTVTGLQVEGVINLAGVLGTPELFGHERKSVETNILGAINVYDVAAMYKIPVVQIGTGHKGQPNPYAITKACAEDLGLARAKSLGEKINVVRAYHVYGPGQPVGPPHGTASVHKFFPTFACRALTGMDLELCGGGSQLIDPVYVDEVAEVLVDALRPGYGRLIEAGTGIGIPVSQVAKDIRNAANAEVLIKSAGKRLGEPIGAIVVADYPECRKLWPYKVEETVDWYRQWLKDHS